MKKKIALSLCLAIAPTLITLLSNLTLSFAPSSLSAQIPSEGLVAWYPFNGNANDESGNGNHGVVNGATLTMDRNETANSAYSFDGTLNDIIQSNLPVMNNSFCITGWYKSNYPTTYYPRIFYYGNSPLNQVQTGFGMVTAGIMGNEPSWISNYTGKFYQEVNINNTAVWSLDNTINGSWHFFTVQYDLTDQNLTMHIDGVFNTAVNVGVNAINSGQLTIGNSPQNAFGGCTGCGSFNGLVDDVAIYNRALSSSEIQQLYQDQTGQVQQPLTCNITAPVTSICAGESVTLSVNTTGSTGSSSPLPANLQEGLVAYYPFNGNANDESGNGIDGIANGATLIADRFGNSNSAYSFDGVDDYISFPNSNTIGITSFSGITISLWFQVNLVENIRIFHFFNQSLDLTIHNSSLGAVHCANYNSAGGGFNFLQIATPPSNQLVHFTWSLDFISNTASVYLDGMLHNQIPIPGAILSSDMMYEIGTANGWILNGSVDDVAIFSRALSPAEIQQLYTSQSFSWNTGATTNSINVTPTMDTTYSCTVTQGNSTCTASVDITVNPAVTNDISATIIEGETYTLGTQTLTGAGTYTEVFTSTAGCDSTVTLTLSVEPLLTCNITSPTSALCAGESVNLSVNASGGSEIIPNLTNLMFLTNYEGHDYYLYTDFLSWEDAKTYGDQNGLSMYIMNSAAEANAIYATLPFLGVDNVHYWIGLYQDLNDPSYSEPSGGWKWVDGTNLNSGYSNWATGEPNDASPGEHYAQFEWSNYGLQWNDAGFPAQNGTQYSLTIYELGGGNLTNASFSWSNNATEPTISVSPTTNTTYSCTVTSGSQTCTATVDIAVNPAVTNTTNASIVEGGSYILGTQTLTTAGTYTEVFTSATGCDSTVTLTLTVEPLLTCNITAPITTICAGESVTLSVNTTGNAGSSSQLPANLQQGLVAYYPFNGNANDESGNGNDGTVNGAVMVNDRFGSSNSAYSFNGFSSFISVPDIAVQSNFNRATSFWFNTESNLGGMFISTGSGSNQNGGTYNIRIIDEGYLSFMGGNFTSCCYDINPTSSTYIKDGLWHHALVNYESGSFYFYMDGILINTVALAINTNGQFNYFGKSNDANLLNASFYNGILDDVFIYNRALSTSEIQQLYTTQSYAWNTGATTNSITVTPTMDTTYSCTVTQGNSTCTASVDITVNPAVTNAISASIVEGQSYTLGTQTLTTAGTYTEVFTSSTGCDSTVTLTLAVEPLLTCNITAPVTSICEGESVTLSVNTTGGTGSSPQLPANLQEGLVAYYPFNGNANDESGNGNHGTVNGATLTSDRFGNVNSAYSFNGLNTIINCNSTLGNFGTGDFSISSWVKNNNANTEVKVIVGKRNAPGYGNFFEFGTKPLGYFYEFNANSSGDLSYTNGVGMLSESWDLVTFLRQGSYLKIYQNGILIQSFNTGAIHAFSNDAFFTIGGRYSGTGLAQIFDGDIDDVIVFNRALSLSEIQQLYTSQSFSWNTGATTNSITVTPTMDTTYSCTVTQGNSTCTASVDITVNPAVTNDVSASIVEGETYTLGTQTLTTAGTYTEVFTSATGCDSTVTLTLAVEPLLTCNITAPVTTICEGESVTLSVNTTGGAGSSSQLPANLQQGLVAYYPFNGNANDESGNGNDGSPFGGPLLVQDKQGAQNSAYSFDGVNDAIEISAVDAMMPSNLTISFWMRPNFNALYGHVIRSRFYGYIFYLNNGTLNFQLHNSWPESTWTNSTANISNWNPNEWHHITGTFDGFSNKLYVDGNLVAEVLSTVSSIVYSSDGLIVLGRDGNTGNVPGASHYSGDLDEVMFYDIALSPAEIQQLYTSQSYSWNTGAITNSITVTPTANTTHSCTVTQGTQTCTDSIAITVNPALTWYADADGDGFGNPNAVVLDCNQPAGYVTDNTDCNDVVASAYPGGEEICGNNIDEDCNGQDSICFVAVLGCTNANACNFNPLANTDDNSCILPQPEVCDGLDNNCNNQVDEGFTIPTINPVAVTPALYPTCTGNALKSADFNAGTNSPIIDGNGPDLWYSFTAQFNTLRVGLSAAFGDNSIGLYTLNNGCLELITEEHEVYTATTLATGNQILLSDQLIVGQTYYVAVHQITGPTNASAKVCFTYLNGSACDHYYSNNTGVYTSVCNSFKAQYRANATNYIFNVLSGTQNGVNMNLTPWSYTNNNSNSVVARLGSILPANHSGVSRVYTLAVPVVYGLTDAAGNVSNLLANATTNCTVTLNSEATIALRQADRCPATKSITATIAPDRSVCGAIRYDWEFTQVLPTPGTAQVVQGGAYASVFFLSNVPGVAAGKTYNVRVRPVHSSGTTGNWGAVHCMRIGAAGMVLQSESENESGAGMESRVSGIFIYPNPTATGSFVLQYNGSRRGEWTFAQEPTNTESNSAQELKMLDITGKVVYQQQVVLNGNAVEIKFGDLASGVYVVMVGEERMRLIVK